MFKTIIIAAVGSFFALTTACSRQEAQTAANTAASSPPPASSPAPQKQPGKTFTAADIAKLKWLEGSWRGMDGDKPFFERYRFDGTTMIVEALEDESQKKVTDTSRFELKDGEFGHTQDGKRAAASEITEKYVQFVPVTGGGNSFRFEHQPDGTWRAILEWTGPDNAARQKTYIMEPIKK